MSSSRKCTGRLFHTRGPAAAKPQSVAERVMGAWNTARSVEDPPKPGVCHQPGTEVPGRTETTTSKRQNPLRQTFPMTTLSLRVVTTASFLPTGLLCC